MVWYIYNGYMNMWYDKYQTMKFRHGWSCTWRHGHGYGRHSAGRVVSSPTSDILNPWKPAPAHVTRTINGQTRFLKPEYKSHERLGLDRRDGNHAPSRMPSITRLIPGMNNTSNIYGANARQYNHMVMRYHQDEGLTEMCNSDKNHKYWFSKTCTDYSLLGK